MIRLLILTSFLSLMPATVFAQDLTPVVSLGSGEPAEVMVVGVFHFANPNADTAQFEGIDIMSERRQIEIMRVIEDLSRFHPTKIALEARRSQGDHAETLMRNYEAYKAGDFEMSSNEFFQLGFRLAHRFSHSEVYAVDFGLGLDIPEMMQYAAEKDKGFSQWFSQYIALAERLINTHTATETIGSTLRWMNRADTLALAQAGYAKMAAVGADDTYIGAKVASQWYERNVHIFGNIASIAEPGDRIILFIGQGHAPILRQLVRDHIDMKLVEPNDYLR